MPTTLNAGATVDEIVAVLVAVVPIVGLPAWSKWRRDLRWRWDMTLTTLSSCRRCGELFCSTVK